MLDCSHLTENRTPVPNSIIKHKKINSKAKLVWILLFSYCWRNQEIYPDIARLSKEAGCSRTTLHRAIKTLEKMSLVVTIRDSGVRGNKYEMYAPSKVDGDELVLLFKPKKKERDNQQRSYPKYTEWRNLVFDKCNYTCAKCLKKGGYLNAHHIESYANNKDLRTTLDNGIVLCKECHKELHHIYGHDAGRSNLVRWLYSKTEV